MKKKGGLCQRGAQTRGKASAGGPSRSLKQLGEGQLQFTEEGGGSHESGVIWTKVDSKKALQLIKFKYTKTPLRIVLLKSQRTRQYIGRRIVVGIIRQVNHKNRGEKREQLNKVLEHKGHSTSAFQGVGFRNVKNCAQRVNLGSGPLDTTIPSFLPTSLPTNQKKTGWK